MIVVDIGCMTYPGYPEDESMLKLIDRFRPEVYYGFDPHPAQNEYDGSAGSFTPQAVTIVRRQAAWKYDGTLALMMPPAVVNPLRTFTTEKASVQTPRVTCFDLARWLVSKRLWYGLDEKFVVKMDCEGAEYELIEYLESTEAMRFIDLLLVEFHGDRERPSISVPWEEW